MRYWRPRKSSARPRPRKSSLEKLYFWQIECPLGGPEDHFAHQESHTNKLVS